MSNAAVSKVEFAAAPATSAYQCATEGCVALTATVYCATHAEHCADCGAEVEAGSRIGERCDECQRRECGLDMEDYGTPCICGGHKPTSYRTAVEMGVR